MGNAWQAQLRLKAEEALRRRRELGGQLPDIQAREEAVKAEMVETLAEEILKDVIAHIWDCSAEKFAVETLVCDYAEDLANYPALRAVVESFAPQLPDRNVMLLVPKLMRLVARRLNEKLCFSLEGTKMQHTVQVTGDDIVTPIKKRIMIMVRV